MRTGAPGPTPRAGTSNKKDVDTTWRFEADALRSALDDATVINLEDGFTFEIASGSRIEAETEDGGWRFSVRALLDGRHFEQFILDVNIAVDDPRLRWTA